MVRQKSDHWQKVFQAQGIARKFCINPGILNSMFKSVNIQVIYYYHYFCLTKRFAKEFALGQH